MESKLGLDTLGLGLDPLHIGVQVTCADKVGVALGGQRQGLDYELPCSFSLRREEKKEEEFNNS